MKLRIQVPLLILGTLLTGLSGAAYRQWTGSLSENIGLTEAAAQLNGAQIDLGDWELQTSSALEDDVVDMLQCAGYVSQTYIHNETKQIVDVALLLGPAGPIAVHSPEICYSSREYSLSSGRRRVEFEDAESTAGLWALDLRSNNVHGNRIRVYYGWSDGGEWQAPDSARLSFAGRPYLYKIQVAGRLPGTDLAADQFDPCEDFLQAYLPLVRQYLRRRPTPV